MGCTCAHNNNGIELSVKIRHVYGNVLRLAAPLTLRSVEVVNGVITTSDSDFAPSSDYPVSFVFDKGAMQVKLLAKLRGGNIAYIEDIGTIPIGTYSITILCKDDFGNPYRFKERSVLQVVDTTAEAGIQAGIEYEVTEHILNSAIFFASGAADRGIDHISTSYNEGVTTVTFFLTDGTTESFQVTQGIEQIVDQDWDITSERAIANKVVTGFRNDIVTTLEDRSNVVGETLHLVW